MVKTRGGKGEDFSVDAFEVFVLIMHQSMCVQHLNHKATSKRRLSECCIVCLRIPVLCFAVFI